MMYKDISFFLFHEAYSKIYAQFLRFWDFTTFIAYSIHNYPLNGHPTQFWPWPKSLNFSVLTGTGAYI